MKTTTQNLQLHYNIDGSDLPVLQDVKCGLIVEKWYPIRHIYKKILGKSNGIVKQKRYSDIFEEKKVYYKSLGRTVNTKCCTENDTLKILAESGGFDTFPFGKIGKYKQLLDLFPKGKSKQLEAQFNVRRDYLIDRDLNKIEKIFDRKTRNLYESGDVLSIYGHYMDNRCSIKFPLVLRNKNAVLDIITDSYNRGKIDKNKIVANNILSQLYIPMFSVTSNDIYSHLFGEDFLYYPWKYKNYNSVNLSLEDAKTIFLNYLDELKISKFDIGALCSISWTKFYRDCKLERFINDNSKKLDRFSFVLHCIGYDFPLYKFQNTGGNLWRNRVNRVSATRSMIDEMKIKVDEIPMYISNSVVQSFNKTMYMVLTKYYDGNIYKMINEAYPNMFKEDMFYITNLKNKFDSKPEGLVDLILRDYFDIVIYNQRHTENTVTINGNQPDWIAIKDGDAYIIEYFGLYEPSQVKSTRVRQYIDRTHEKIDSYKRLTGYKTLYIYPQDIKDEYLLLKDKLSNLNISPLNHKCEIAC